MVEAASGSAASVSGGSRYSKTVVAGVHSYADAGGPNAASPTAINTPRDIPLISPPCWDRTGYGDPASRGH